MASATEESACRDDTHTLLSTVQVLRHQEEHGQINWEIGVVQGHQVRCMQELVHANVLDSLPAHEHAIEKRGKGSRTKHQARRIKSDVCV